MCAPGIKSNGGTCKCEKAKAWNEGTWSAATCDEGLCKMFQSYEKCEGKYNGYQLGDDTWCWDERRFAKCPAVSGLNYLYFCPFHWISKKMIN